MSTYEFNPQWSTNDIWNNENQERCLTDDLDEMATSIATKADDDHAHSEYALLGHTHTGYSTTNHTHDNYVGASYVDTKVAELVDSAPSTLNTLNELAAALGDDPSFATTITNQIGTKANAADLTAHTDNKSNPHGVTLSQLGVTATAAELNYVDGVTSNVQTQLNAKAATNHNHSASNITSGTLAVARGGTGSTSATTNVTLNRGANTGTDSSAYGYDCKYIPYLNMCFVRVYAQPKSTWTADAEYEVATIGSSTYYPGNMVALSNYAQKEVSAYVNTEGQIVVRPYESVGTSYGIRLAGFWFCD
jgi:hypothetical protein